MWKVSLSQNVHRRKQNKKRNHALGGDEQTSRYSSSVDLVFSHDGLTTGRAKPTLDHPDKYQRRIARSTEGDGEGIALTPGDFVRVRRRGKPLDPSKLTQKLTR